MSKRLSLAAILATVIAVAGASFAYAGDSSDDGSTQVIQLVAMGVDATPIDLGKTGPSQGDQVVFTNDLFREGEKVGFDGGVCTAVRVGPGESVRFQCQVTLSLPKGQITAQGLFMFAGPPSDIAITGGTGAYRRVDGELEVDIVSNTETRLTAKLVH